MSTPAYSDFYRVSDYPARAFFICNCGWRGRYEELETETVHLIGDLTQERICCPHCRVNYRAMKIRCPEPEGETAFPKRDAMHSPGPWSLLRDIYLEDGNGKCAAIFDMRGGKVFNNPNDARIICAAPEMLAALVDCIACMSKFRADPPWGVTIQNGIAAIQLAERGRQ